MLENGATLAVTDNNGDTYLHYAASKDAHTLIETYSNLTSATVNVKNKIGKTPLHIAARLGHLKTVQILINCGADVNIRYKSPITTTNLFIYHHISGQSSYI